MGTQFTGTTFQNWIEKNGITHTTSSAYRPDNNQAAEAAVKRAKGAILHLLKEHPHLKVNDHEVQSLIHDMAHENMPGQEATAHQALYFSMGQDMGVEINHRADWWDIRNNLLQTLLDENTEGPGDGSISINPARRDPFQSRDPKTRSDYEVFEKGDAVSIKETSDRKCRLGWIMGRAEDIEHHGTAFDNTEGRRYMVELTNGTVGTFDAKSLKRP